MLFCETDFPFYLQVSAADGVAKDEMALRNRALTRELDDLRHALKRLRDDYDDAVNTAAALQEALVRADVRNRRSEAEAARHRQVALVARKDLDLAEQRRKSDSMELSRCEALLQNNNRLLEEQRTHAEGLASKNAEAADQCSIQQALILEYQGRLLGQEAQLKHLNASVRRSSKPMAKFWFRRSEPSERPTYLAQRP